MAVRGLGRGIDSILPADINLNRLVPGVSVTEIDISKVVPNPEQPRRTISELHLSELAASIQEHGVLQPLLVTKQDKDTFMIIAGERRFRAAKQVGLKKVPCIVRTLNDMQTLEVALIENMQREDLSPLEQAVSIKRLHDDFGQTYEQIAKGLGRGYASVANMVRLLKLPDEMQNALAKGEISEGHARALLALDGNKQQQILFESICKNQWSVRRAEQFVQEVKTHSKPSKKSIQRTSQYIEDSWTKSLSKKLDTKVVINPKAKGGFVKIEYGNDSELESIKKLLT